MGKPETEGQDLLPITANILGFIYEPHLSLRLRLGELPPTLTPGETSAIADVIFTGVQGLELSLDFNAENPCLTKLSTWQDHGFDALHGPTKDMSIETTKGSIKVVCDSIKRIDLVKTPVERIRER